MTEKGAMLDRQAEAQERPRPAYCRCNVTPLLTTEPGRSPLGIKSDGELFMDESNAAPPVESFEEQQATIAQHASLDPDDFRLTVRNRDLVQLETFIEKAERVAEEHRVRAMGAERVANGARAVIEDASRFSSLPQSVNPSASSGRLS